ncbi:MAG: hypothetical protein ACJ746_02470 [Bryobacteraceae bacterium]
MAKAKDLLSAFFNLHLRRGLKAVEIENPSLLEQLAPVIAGAQALGFTEPIIRGGAVRDGLQGREINDYDLYVSRLQVVEGLTLPSIKAPAADDFYSSWLSARLGLSGLEPHRQRLMDRPYLAFNVRFAGVERPVDLVINDEILSPEKLALQADATMNAVAASRTKIAAHPLFLPDNQARIFRPTCATIGNLISAPARYRMKFACRDPELTYKWF